MIRPPAAVAAVAVAVVVAVAGCGGGDEGGSPASTAATTSGPGPTRLAVTAWPAGRGAGPVVRLTLTCDPPGGTVPDPAAACAAVRAHPDALRPIPADRACTQIWGGPARARVTGRVDGVPVAVELDRSDGCRIDQWDRLAPPLPEPASP